MGRLIRETDWSATPLGPPHAWPQPLRMAIRLMLTTQHPIFIFWGDALTCFYNDAYAASLGPEKHPRALGAPAVEVWPETWHVISPQIEHVMAGKGATWHENQLIPIDRHGAREDVYWTYSYSPIDDPAQASGVGGVLVICNETTTQMLSEQHQRADAQKAQVSLRETHHRVKNNIATVMAIVRLEKHNLGESPLKHALDRIHARLDSFAQLYEMMLVAGDDDVIDAGLYIRRLCDKLGELTSSSFGAEVDCRVDTASVRVSPDDAIALGIVAMELANNAVTHAFNGRETGAIDVSLLREGDDFVFTVADDGVGSDHPGAKPSLSTGIGMKLVEHYADVLEGSLETQAGGRGTTVRLRFPASREIR